MLKHYFIILLIYELFRIYTSNSHFLYLLDETYKIILLLFVGQYLYLVNHRLFFAENYLVVYLVDFFHIEQSTDYIFYK